MTIAGPQNDSDRVRRGGYTPGLIVITLRVQNPPHRSLNGYLFGQVNLAFDLYRVYKIRQVKNTAFWMFFCEGEGQYFWKIAEVSVSPV